MLNTCIYRNNRVVLNASALPDPQVVSYDLFLAYVSFLQSALNVRAKFDPIDTFFRI